MTERMAGRASWKQYGISGGLQQSCFAQLVARNSAGTEPCIGFRRQHLCARGVVTASATGAKSATTNVTSSSLAVSGRMIVF
jgi:hypothetical protein